MILKENMTIELQSDQIKEEYPCCGALLINTFQNRRKVYSPSLEQEQVIRGAVDKPSQYLPVAFKTAYRQIEDSSLKLAFGIEKIDSRLDLHTYGSLCIIGEPKHIQLLIDRLCVHSLLPRRYGGIVDQTLKILVIDAGNRTDIYQLVDFARQYGLEVKKVLQSIVVSRVIKAVPTAEPMKASIASSESLTGGRLLWLKAFISCRNEIGTSIRVCGEG
jgi:hypothetical protein